MWWITFHRQKRRKVGGRTHSGAKVIYSSWCGDNANCKSAVNSCPAETGNTQEGIIQNKWDIKMPHTASPPVLNLSLCSSLTWIDVRTSGSASSVSGGHICLVAPSLKSHLRKKTYVWKDSEAVTHKHYSLLSDNIKCALRNVSGSWNFIWECAVTEQSCPTMQRAQGGNSESSALKPICSKGFIFI